MTDKDIEEHKENEIVEKTIEIFQKRARNNKIKAVISLIAIGLTLFITVGIFYFASSLTAKDIDVYTGKKSDLLISKKAELKEIKSKLRDLLQKKQKIINNANKVLSGGGEHWEKQNLKYSGEIYSIKFFNSKNGIVAVRDPGKKSKENYLLVTNDGGKSWDQKYIIEKGHFFDAHFLDERRGWISGYYYSGEISIGVVIKTEDGYSTWQRYDIPFDNVRLRGSVFLDSKNWCVFGENLETDQYELFSTADGGQTWSKSLLINVPAVRYLSQIFFIDKHNGWAVGKFQNSNSTGGLIMKTNDGGKTWHNQQIEYDSEIENVFFLDLNKGYAFGKRRGVDILFTDDGGKTWNSKTIGFNDLRLSDVFFFNEKKWIIIGYEIIDDGRKGGLYQGVILSTIDGGNNFKYLKPDFIGEFYKVYFDKNQNGWIGGRNRSRRPFTCTLVSTENYLEDGHRIGSIEELTKFDINSDQNRILKDIGLKDQAVNMIEAETRFKRRMLELEYDIDDLKKVEFSNKSSSNFYYILSTNITRIGILLVAIFFVQILVSIYRYKIHLSGFYEARADAIRLSRAEGHDLISLINALSPEKVHHGKTPVSPIQNIIELVKGVHKSP